MHLSIIIPAHNEAGLIRATVAAARDAVEATGHGYEIIVVDDASTDATVNEAGAGGARVLSVDERKIAAVRNRGAAASTGDLLIFLDADTVLPPETLNAAIAAVQAGAIGGGARVRFEPGASAASRFGVWLWNRISRTLRWAAGSFVFARRDMFEQVGGFDEQYFAAEEIFFSAAMKKQGPFVIVPERVITSARKERSYGILGQLRPALRVLLTGGRALKQREGLDLWYEARRESPDPNETKARP